MFWSGAADFFNLLLAAYFIIGNGTYTVLMLLSVVSVWLHQRRRAYEGLQQLRESPLTPPVTILVPAWSEQAMIVESVHSVLRSDYPGLQVCVVDDGSSDGTVARLVEAFKMVPAFLISRSRLPTGQVLGYHVSPDFPNLLLIRKERGGKADALNAALNQCRTPYFCTLDADCVLDRDAILRLMRPVLRSRVPVVASGGLVRVLNGCMVKEGRIVHVKLPRHSLERFQVVEYLRSFFFGRTGWNLIGGTLIVSGAFALFHRETVIEAGGFKLDTVTEDMELVVRLQRWAREHHRRVRISFSSDPVCWSECPSSFQMLARQRRRWQLGLLQTLRKAWPMFFNPAFGLMGLFSLPFHAFVEGFGAVVETIGYLVIPVAAVVDRPLLRVLLPLVLFSLAYATCLSVAAVALEEGTYHRYRSARELTALLIYALLENFGYRQLVLWFRFEGVLRFLTGFRRWEKVIHVAAQQQSPA
jgi:cellulose synthase/poly-beta-1,6-N-acetylglucosamine synthase-like glycosyltransferase